jgi:transcriptional regulator with XRE-family HTH domain
MERLKQYLAKQNVTQAQFAALMGVSQPTVWEWVNGHSRPGQGRLKKLSKLTRIPLEDLLPS